MFEFSTIAGRYSVSRLLYTRGVSSSYLATDSRDSDRQVLLEVAPVGEVSVSRQLFLDQLSGLTDRLMALEHSNLTPIRSFLVDGPYYGFVKTYEEGELLESWLDGERGGASDSLRIGLCRDVLEGLAALHSIGILHRDLNPRCIWLRAADEQDSRRVAQIDHFYRSVLETEYTLDRELLLSTGRVAPEVSAGDAYSPGSDVFAVGLLLLEILGKGRQGGFGGFESTRSLSEEEIREQVPAPYSEVVIRATRPSRLERFQDGLDLLAAFDAMDIERRLGGAVSEED